MVGLTGCFYDDIFTKKIKKIFLKKISRYFSIPCNVNFSLIGVIIGIIQICPINNISYVMDRPVGKSNDIIVIIEYPVLSKLIWFDISK